MNKMFIVATIGILTFISSHSYAEQPATSRVVYKCRSHSGLYAYQATPCIGKVSTASSWVSPDFNDTHQKPEALPLILKESPAGAYLVQGSANAAPLTFVVDTGSPILGIPKAVADQAGMKCLRKITTATATANGEAHGCESLVEKLTFGKYSLRNVRALIMPNLAQPLLGMNVLNQFKVKHDKGMMIISTTSKSN